MSFLFSEPYSFFLLRENIENVYKKRGFLYCLSWEKSDRICFVMWTHGRDDGWCSCFLLPFPPPRVLDSQYGRYGCCHVAGHAPPSLSLSLFISDPNKTTLQGLHLWWIAIYLILRLTSKSPDRKREREEKTAGSKGKRIIKRKSLSKPSTQISKKENH